jgi:hypothetical protein
MRIKNSWSSFSDISTVKRDLNPASTQATLYRTGTLDVLTLTLGRLQAGHECGQIHISVTKRLADMVTFFMTYPSLRQIDQVPSI